MIDILRGTQIPFLAGVLLLACVTKLTLRHGEQEPVTSLHRRRWFVRGVALAEGTLGVALLVTPLGIVRLLNVVFFATATSIVADLTRRGSDEGCGCFGALSARPAGRRGTLRVALLTVTAIASAGEPHTGLGVLHSLSGWSVVALVAETALLLALSPEPIVLMERWGGRSAPCELRAVPLTETYATLHASDAWRDNASRLTSAEPSEVWRELCDRYVVYPATMDGRPIEVVFAVPIGGRPSSVRVGLSPDTAPVEEQDDDSGPQRVASPA